jgi:CRISPR-associated protein Csm4
LKLYEIIIEPISGIGTPLKGDTMFGHFCWQVAYVPDLVEGGLESLIGSYAQRPGVVFSSAFPVLESGQFRYALKRPDIPLSILFPSKSGDRIHAMKERKENKKKRWMLVEKDLRIVPDKAQCIDGSELVEMIRAGDRKIRSKAETGTSPTRFERVFPQPHNTINRMTGTTGTGEFAPFTLDSIHYHPGTRLVVFVLIDEAITTVDRVAKALRSIGKFGFGRDASTGLGRFSVIGHNEHEVPAPGGANSLYCLSPCVPERGTFTDAYFSPFVRFGKHGDRLGATRLPFKNPVLMADEGAVFVPADSSAFDQGYFGRAVTDLSRAEPHTVAQGYSVCLPMKMEV